MKTPITTGEATFDALQASWSRVLALAVVAWLGVAAGHWLTQDELSIWAGNPLSWLYYQSQALKFGWGYLLLFLQILSFYIWTFTDSFRLISLITSFVSNGLQAYVVYRVIRVDSILVRLCRLGFDNHHRHFFGLALLSINPQQQPVMGNRSLSQQSLTAVAANGVDLAVRVAQRQREEISKWTPRNSLSRQGCSVYLELQQLADGSRRRDGWQAIRQQASASASCPES